MDLKDAMQIMHPQYSEKERIALNEEKHTWSPYADWLHYTYKALSLSKALLNIAHNFNGYERMITDAQRLVRDSMRQIPKSEYKTLSAARSALASIDVCVKLSEVPEAYLKSINSQLKIAIDLTNR